MAESDIDTLRTFTPYHNDDTPAGDLFLRVNWYNGDPKLRTPGAFFVSKKRLDALGMDEPCPPWRVQTRTFSSGREEEGFCLERARLQIIGVRRQDVVLDADGYVKAWLTAPVDRNNRPEGWSIFVEVLGYMPGFDTVIVWSSKRVKTSMAILTNILRDFKYRVLDPARKHYKNPKIPTYAFWAQVRSAVDAKGFPIYEKTRGTHVTPPILIVPDKSDAALFESLYVGNDLLRWAEEQRMYYDAWLRQRPGDARISDPRVTNGEHQRQKNAEDAFVDGINDEGSMPF